MNGTDLTKGAKSQVTELAKLFISAVYKLAEHCNYGAMQEEMITDRLVVGIRHQGLSESLQMDSELTLAKAVLKIKQHEEKPIPYQGHSRDSCF